MISRRLLWLRSHEQNQPESPARVHLQEVIRSFSRFPSHHLLAQLLYQRKTLPYGIPKANLILVYCLYIAFDTRSYSSFSLF
jgi:hypothetical protein